MITRRRFLAGSAVAGIGVAADMRLIEPRWIRTARVGVPLSTGRLSRPLRILHISDMHASDVIPVSFIKKAIAQGLAEKPDLACITGDLISRHIPDQDAYTAALRDLSNVCPTFACVGNHDGGSWAEPHGGYCDLSEIRVLLEAANISLLFNTSEALSINGNAVQLVGLGDYWADDVVAQRAFPSQAKPESACRIVLSHNPDAKVLLNAYSWDLMLCGHTHGGQLSLPFLGTPFAPVRDHGYVDGLNMWKGRPIYTTKGIGNLHGLRLNCRPEVAILELS